MSRASASSTPSPTAIRRLSRDLQKLKEEPIDGIEAMPLEENILEWHYVIKGSKGTPFEGGFYHGKLVFPAEFPWKPPSIYMFTPNGRFLPNQRLCLSISDYHPETWNPGWTVSAILVGLHSFMNESSIATGTETTTDDKKKELAEKSASFNMRDKTFSKLFPTLIKESEKAGVTPMTDEQAAEATSRPSRYNAGGLALGAQGEILRQGRLRLIDDLDAAMFGAGMMAVGGGGGAAAAAAGGAAPAAAAAAAAAPGAGAGGGDAAGPAARIARLEELQRQLDQQRDAARIRIQEHHREMVAAGRGDFMNAFLPRVFAAAAAAAAPLPQQQAPPPAAAVAAAGGGGVAGPLMVAPPPIQLQPDGPPPPKRAAVQQLQQGRPDGEDQPAEGRAPDVVTLD